jgi:hypothetical protein
VILACPSIDRRYRPASFQIDARRGLYDTPYGQRYAADDATHLQAAYGIEDFDAKFRRWKNIAYPTLGIIDEYSKKIEQIINSYTMGYVYPAVTSACCLAERILNRLVLRCRHHFKAHPEYKRIYRKDSFDDWGVMLNVIEQWQLIPPKAIELFRDLMPIRHQTIHYNDGYDFDAIIVPTINKLIEAIGEVFGVLNRKDIYLVFDVPGEVWVRSQAERLPFVKEFVLPHCYRAHAVHDIDFAKGLITERLGKIGPLTDEEFVKLRKSSTNPAPVSETV